MYLKQHNTSHILLTEITELVTVRWKKASHHYEDLWLCDDHNLLFNASGVQCSSKALLVHYHTSI